MPESTATVSKLYIGDKWIELKCGQSFDGLNCEGCKMKVAVVVPYASFVEVNMCRAFEQVGIEPWIVKSNKERFEYRGKGLEFEKYPETVELPCFIDNALVGGYAPFPIMPHVFDVVKELSPDIVNVSEHVSSATWLFSLQKRGWKTVLTEHGSGWRNMRDKMYNLLAGKLLIQRIDGFVGIGFRAKHFLESLGAQNVKVIPNPVNCQLFKPDLPHGEKQNIVLYVGKVDTFKGLHILLPAIKLVRKKIQNAKLWIIGKQGNLAGYIKENDASEYLGSKPHHEMPAYYNQAKVFVNPLAHPILAGCGCATSEALACGTPVVATGYLDFPFAWRNGEVGYLSDNATPSGLADAITRVLLSTSKIQQKCRELALREFSYQSVGKRYLELFRKVLEKRQ